MDEKPADEILTDADVLATITDDDKDATVTFLGPVGAAAMRKKFGRSEPPLAEVTRPPANYVVDEDTTDAWMDLPVPRYGPDGKTMAQIDADREAAGLPPIVVKKIPLRRESDN